MAMRCVNITNIILLLFLALPANAEDWRGLTIAEEYRCSEYNKKRDYSYRQSVEDKIISAMNGVIYGPYTGRTFNSKRETDIEHIVAASEGHDSGLCSADAQTRKMFARDLLNLTLAAPEVNRCGVNGKCGKDAAEWMPEQNKCWFAQRVVDIRLKYNLTIDSTEAQALDAVLVNCESTDMIFYESVGQHDVGTRESDVTASDALALYDDNHNGRITCSEARKHGIAPVYSNHPAYTYMDDRDGDGVVCE